MDENSLLSEIVEEVLGEAIPDIIKLVLKVELSKGESSKIIRQLGGDEEEIILLQKTAKFWNQNNRWDRPDEIVVVTNYRFLFLTKIKTITSKTDYVSIPYEFIKNLSVKRIYLISPAIEFEAENKKFVFTFYSNAKEVAEQMNKFL